MWYPSPTENGLIERFEGMGLSSNSVISGVNAPKENLMQVMNAVEAAETTIKHQVQEINQLRSELQRKTWELENFKSDASTELRPPLDGSRDAYKHVGPYKKHPPNFPLVREEDRVRWMDGNSSLDSHGTLVIHPNPLQENNDPGLRTRLESHHFSQSSNINGTMKVFSGGQAGVDHAGFSHISTPSSRPLSSSRHQKGEYDHRPNLSGQGLLQMPEISSSTGLWKDLVPKLREREEEVVQLRKQLAEYSIKETQIRNEKIVLEKRIAHMRMAFDQQQQALVDAASKALSYRQDIIEENIRLTYALQAAEQERHIFLSSLLPLLAEYDFQPHVLDAQSIVCNLKILIQHLRKRLDLSEAKLKESQFQFPPWRSDAVNNSNFIPQSPSHSGGTPPTVTGRNGLEIVPQPVYSHAQTPISSSTIHTTRSDLEIGQPNHHTGMRGAASKNLALDDLERPSSSRNVAAQDMLTRFVPQNGPHVTRLNGENVNKHLSFNDLVNNTEMYDSDAAGPPNEREPSGHWASGSSPYVMPHHEDPNSSFSPNLPPVLEEPSSSFSEVAEDDPLPGIDGLQIAGEAFPGRRLLACGYSINRTTSCNFEWVRYMQDGSVNYIPGASQPNYLVTADDVETYLAIEVVPLDDRKRKGELVKVFANEQRKITCDPEMQGNIERYLFNGSASFEVSLSAGYMDIWEPAILSIKREGYSIRCNEPRGAVVTEKFSPNNSITIPYGEATEFSILSSNGTEYLLRTVDNSLLRDTIVLTMRLFLKRAMEKKKKKKGLFFNK